MSNLAGISALTNLGGFSSTVSETDELAELEALLQAEEADRGLRDLFYFDKYILGYKDMEPRTHRPVCEFLDDGKPRKHLELSRGCFKSSVGTIGYTLQSVAKNPNIRILIDNEVYANSKAFLREIKSHMERDDVLALYPQLRPNKRINDGWTESTVIVEARTRETKEPNISCAGLDQIKVGMHYDLIIMDDLVSDRNVTTREQIDKVINHYKLALSLLEPDGQLILIGTRYNYADLYGYIMKNESETFDSLIIPAKLTAEVAEDLNRRFPDIVSELGFYKAGDIFFPERLDEDFLKAQRKSQGTYIYNCQYLLNPVDSETADFKKEWNRYHRSHIELDPEDNSQVLVVDWIGDYNKNTAEGYEFPLRYKIKKLITVDPNNKKKKTSDFTAGIALALTTAGDWFILDIFRDILNPGEQVNLLFRVQEQYEPNLLGLEENGKEAIRFMLIQRMRHESKFFRITELKTGGVAKEDRIRRLIPRFEYGTIFFPVSLVKRNSYGVTADLVEALEDELAYFPSGEHDDLIDALAYMEDLVALVYKKEAGNKRKKGNSKGIFRKSNLPKKYQPMADREEKEGDWSNVI